MKVGFIGGGKMATALIEGGIRADIIKKEEIFVSDILKERINYFRQNGIQSFSDNKKLVNECNVIFLSVKPNSIKNVISEIKGLNLKEKLVISIAAGITLSQLYNYFDNKKLQIIRVMPNTPALVGEGMSVYTYREAIDKKYLNFIENLLNGVGKAIYLDEKYFDVVTALSGSGPAYIFVIINSLADGGVKMGLTKDISLKLAAQTVLGSAKMVLDTKKHPEILKDMVSSPGGTTVEGVFSLEKYNIRAALIEAVQKATEKSINLQK